MIRSKIFYIVIATATFISYHCYQLINLWDKHTILKHNVSTTTRAQSKEKITIYFNNSISGKRKNTTNHTISEVNRVVNFHGERKHDLHAITIGKNDSKNIVNGSKSEVGQEERSDDIRAIALGKNGTSKIENITTQSIIKADHENKSQEDEGNHNLHAIASGRNGTADIVFTNQSASVIDLVVKSQGELGNHLHAIALGKTMQYLAKEAGYPLRFKIHYLGQKSGSASQRNKRNVGKDIKACFPSLQHVEFRECNKPSYDKILSHQEHLFGKNASNLIVKKSISVRHSVFEMKKMFQFLIDSLKEGRYVPFHKLQTVLNDVNILALNIPFLLADSFCYFELIDRYHKELRDFFNFNHSACCILTPDPDETVVHVRGFATEMKKKRIMEPKYTELDANRMANELLSHLKKGDKVALLSRFAATLKPYKYALEQRDLKVRIVAGQSVMADFCFLMSTTKELVGMISSTYVVWASLLSSSVQKVTLYRTAIFAKVENRYMPGYPQFKDSQLNATFNFPIF